VLGKILNENNAICPSAEPVSSADLPYFLKNSFFFSVVKYMVIYSMIFAVLRKRTAKVFIFFDIAIIKSIKNKIKAGKLCA
jgi:hypothetical protein